jgi:hypothetical protein
VFAIRHAAVVGFVLCIAIAGARAQDDQSQAPAHVLRTPGNPDYDAIARHRLTVDNVRQMFAVDRDLLELMRQVPDLWTRVNEGSRRFDPDGAAGIVSGDAKLYEAIPEIAQILRKHRISARAYLLTKLVAMVTQMADEALAHEGNDVPDPLMTPALKFWRGMDPALKAEAAEWKIVREEMQKVEHSNGRRGGLQ